MGEGVSNSRYLDHQTIYTDDFDRLDVIYNITNYISLKINKTKIIILALAF